MIRTKCFTTWMAAFLTSLCAGALLGCSDDGGDPEPAATAPRTLTLLYTSDEHSHMLGFSPELDDWPTPTTQGDGSIHGGVTRRATILKREREAAAAAGGSSLTLSAGDNTMGSLSHTTFQTTAVDYAAMAALGYDVTTLGNHEFDFGPSGLASCLQTAKANGALPAIVASNIHFSPDSPDDDELAALFSENVDDDAPLHPYRVIQTDNGINVGVIGYVGINASFTAPNKPPVYFSTSDPNEEGEVETLLPVLYADLQAVVDKLRNEHNVDIVVGLGHAGLGEVPEDYPSSEDYLICENVAGLDVIVSGHEHNADPSPVPVAQNGGRSCVVLNAGAAGAYLGRIVLTVPDDRASAITFDASAPALLTVDGSTVPDPEFATQLDTLVADVEKAGPSGPSFLESLLTRVEGAPVPDDPAVTGDLYFRIIGQTSYDVTDDMSLNFLSADAMLAATDALGLPTDMGLESAGVVRMGLYAGKTGQISTADAFNVVPLGASPADGSVGYPLIRAFIPIFMIRAIFEFGLKEGPTQSIFMLGQAGVKVEYDLTRPTLETSIDIFVPTKGQVMKIMVDSDHSDGFEQYDRELYNRATGFEETGNISVVTSSYVGQFASTVGATLKNENDEEITLQEAILHYPDGAEAKQVESFLSYLKTVGTLPDRYDPASPNATQRRVCLAGCP